MIIKTLLLPLPHQPKRKNQSSHTPPLFPLTQMTHFPKKVFLDSVVVVPIPVLRKSLFSIIHTTTSPINSLLEASSQDWVHLALKMHQKLSHQSFRALSQNAVPPPFNRQKWEGTMSFPPLVKPQTRPHLPYTDQAPLEILSL